MMQAYTDGDIVLIIKEGLLSNDKVFEEFSKLCNTMNVVPLMGKRISAT